MRQLTKSWKGVRDPQTGLPKGVRHTFTLRMRWYEGNKDIRLSIQDEEGEAHNYFTSEEEAQQLWDLFKQGKVDRYGHPTNI